MVSEEISEAEKGEEGKPPRDTAIFRIFRSFYNRHRRAKGQEKKAYTDHQLNERTVAKLEPSCRCFYRDPGGDLYLRKLDYLQTAFGDEVLRGRHQGPR